MGGGRGRLGSGGPAHTCAHLRRLGLPQEAGPQEDAARREAGGGGLGEYHGQRQHRHRGLLAGPSVQPRVVGGGHGATWELPR